MNLVQCVSFVAVGLLSGAPQSLLAYDHSNYNQTGLVFQYDGPDNENSGGTETKLVNLGTAGSAFDMSPVITGNGDGTKKNVAHPDDRVVDGTIVLGKCPGGYYSHGWSSSTVSAAVGGDAVGWTIEYVGAMTAGESKNGYSYVVGIEGTPEGNRMLYLASGQPSTKTIGAEARAGGYNYEGSSFVKGADLLAKSNSETATRTVTLDIASKKVTFYENGVKVGEGTTKGSANAGIKRVNLGDMRTGRGYGWWQGGIKSVRVYSRVLSEAEISANFKIDGYRFYGATQTEIDIAPPVVDNVGQTQADVSAVYTFPDGVSATLGIAYGVSADSLDGEVNLGVKTSTGTFGDTITGLLPATKYYVSCKSDASGAISSSSTNSFVTLGSAVVSGATVSGTKESGVTARATVDPGYVGYAGATVELYFGADADDIKLVRSWANQTANGDYSFTVTDGIGYGTTYYAQFRVVQTVAAGETRETATETVSCSTPADLVWRGGVTGSDFAAAANWSPSVAPSAVATVIFDAAAKAVLADSVDVACIRYATAQDVTLDLGRNTLTAGSLSFGEATGGTLTVTNGTLVLPNGSFSTGAGNTVRLAKGTTLVAPNLVQTAEAFALFVDGGKYEAQTATVDGRIVVGKDGFFRGTSQGKGADYLGSNAAGDGAEILVGEGGSAAFNWFNVGAGGVTSARLVVSNATATIATGPTLNAGSALVLYADADRTAKLSNDGNLNMSDATSSIRVFGGLYTSNSKNYQNIPGELEIARTNGCFKTTNKATPLNVTGSLRFDIPQHGYQQIPLQVAGDLQWGAAAKVYVNVAKFHGTQTVIQAKSLPDGLTADDFVVVEGRQKDLSVAISPAVAATDASAAQPGTVAVTYRPSGFILIVR